MAARGRQARTNFPISDEMVASCKNPSAPVELSADAVAQVCSSVFSVIIHAVCKNVSARVELSVDAATGERLCVCCDPSCRGCVHD